MATTTSDGPRGLYGKLAHAQATMPDLTRDRHVEVKNHEGKHLYSYDYITEDAITKAMRAHLASCGIATLPSYPEVHDLGVEGRENVVRVKVAVLLVDGESGEREVVVGWGDGTDKGDKAIGKAQTSGLRQLLGKLLLQAGGDDGEQANIESQRGQAGAARRGGSFTPSSAQVNRLYAIAKTAGYDRDVVKVATRIVTRVPADTTSIGTDDPYGIPSKEAYERVASFLESQTPDKLTAVRKMIERVAANGTDPLPYEDSAPPRDDVPFVTGGYE